MADLPTPEEFKQWIAEQSRPTPAQNREWLRKKLWEIRAQLGILEGIAGSVVMTLEDDDTVRRVRACTLMEAATLLVQQAENVLYGEE